MRFLFLSAIVFLPTISLAAPRTFAELANLVTNLINGGIGVALILGIVIYFYGIASSMTESNAGKFEKLRVHVTWGIVALFVMFSVWGIVALLRNTLFGGYSTLDAGDGEEVYCTSLDNCALP